MSTVGSYSPDYSGPMLPGDVASVAADDPNEVEDPDASPTLYKRPLHKSIQLGNSQSQTLTESLSLSIRPESLEESFDDLTHTTKNTICKPQKQPISSIKKSNKRSIGCIIGATDDHVLNDDLNDSRTSTSTAAANKLQESYAVEWIESYNQDGPLPRPISQADIGEATRLSIRWPNNPFWTYWLKRMSEGTTRMDDYYGDPKWQASSDGINDTTAKNRCENLIHQELSKKYKQTIIHNYVIYDDYKLLLNAFRKYPESVILSRWVTCFCNAKYIRIDGYTMKSYHEMEDGVESDDEVNISTASIGLLDFLLTDKYGIDQKAVEVDQKNPSEIDMKYKRRLVQLFKENKRHPVVLYWNGKFEYVPDIIPLDDSQTTCSPVIHISSNKENKSSNTKSYQYTSAKPISHSTNSTSATFKHILTQSNGMYIYRIILLLLLLTYIYVLYIHDTAGKHKAK